jgi:hypothetical protein
LTAPGPPAPGATTAAATAATAPAFGYIDPSRRQRLLQGYREALAGLQRTPGGAKVEPPAAGLALLEDALAERPRPGGNPFGRLVTGLAAASDAEVRAEVLRALRPVLVTTFAYAVPGDEALDHIAGLGDIVELGAGGGYWARCLAGRGARVFAFDHKRPSAQQRPAGALVCHHPIFIGGPAEALSAGGALAPTLLLCWPPGIVNRREADAGAPPRYSTMGEEALARFEGPHLVFVGARSRSFGSPAFFAALDGGGWHLDRQIAIPNLGGWRDAVHIYRR